MSLHRYDKKRDSAEPDIITALERIGVEVWPQDRPCDLLCKRPWWPPGLFAAMEVKTIHQGRKKPLKDKRQKAQQTFLETTKTPIVTTPIQAIKAIQAIDAIIGAVAISETISRVPPIQLSCTSEPPGTSTASVGGP